MTVIRSTNRSTQRECEAVICLLTWEPVSGIEPLTCRLQEVRPRAACALAALRAYVIARTALAALGVSRAPFHEPFHADERQRSMTVTERYDRTAWIKAAALRVHISSTMPEAATRFHFGAALRRVIGG
jgi:hypothetical protein